jgi:7-keto-8-aminopelargonate synthetase-like enzyme
VRSAGATRVELEGGSFLYFGGCSYLGLHAHPAVVGAARAAAERYGLSSGAARGSSGTTLEHEAIEAELAAFCGAPACALLPDAALASLALARAAHARGTAVLLDAEGHPTLVDALDAAGARIERYGSCDAAAAAERAARSGARALWTDGTFPSAGRLAPLAELGALGLELLAVDDAHGFGVLGARGAGAAEALELGAGRAALVVALSKALGAAGGAVLGSEPLVERVRGTAAHACTTPLSPALAAAARAALGVVRAEPERRARCLANAARLREIVRGLGLRCTELAFPVQAVQLADRTRTRALHRGLLEAGILAPLVAYPGGPAGEYLRLAVSSEHGGADLDALERSLRALLA